MANIVQPPITGDNQQDSWAYQVTEAMNTAEEVNASIASTGVDVEVTGATQGVAINADGTVPASTFSSYYAQMSVFIGARRIDFNENAVNNEALSPNTYRVSIKSATGSGWPTPALSAVTVDDIDDTQISFTSSLVPANSTLEVVVVLEVHVKGPDGSTLVRQREVRVNKELIPLFTWVKYANNVENIINGRVTSASDVTNFSDSVSGSMRWIGEVHGQSVRSESTDATAYTWRLAPPGLLKPDTIDEDDKPASPTGLVLDSGSTLYIPTDGGGFASRAPLTWGNPSISGKSGASTNIVSYKLSSDSSYTVYGAFGGTNATINNLVSGTYDFKVVAVSALGVHSPDTILSSQVVSGETNDPANPTNLSLNVAGANSQLSWSSATDVDVLSGGSIQIRYHQNTGASVTWATSQIITLAVPGFSTAKTVPTLTGTYLIKFFDAGGRESVSPAVVTNTFAPADFNQVATLDQQTSFSGTKTNCSVVSDRLKLSSNQTMMTYDYGSPLDLKSVKGVRVLPTFTALATSASDTVCNVTLICDRTQFCVVEQQADIRTYISTTQGEPADSGSVWTPYEILVAGEFSARGLRFRITAEVGDTNTTIEFEKIGATIDAPDIIQTGSVTTSVSGDTTVTYPTAFYTGTLGTTLPRIGTQIISSTTGNETVVPTRTATGFTISVYRGGIRRAETIDWQAIGL